MRATSFALKITPFWQIQNIALSWSKEKHTTKIGSFRLYSEKVVTKKKRERMKRTKYPQLTDLIRRVINIEKLNGALTKVVVLLFCWAESVEQSNNCRNRPHYHFQKCEPSLRLFVNC